MISDRFRRIRALVHKEVRETVRDPSTFGIAFILPLVLLVLFGFAVSLDLQHVPIAVVLEKKGVAHRRFLARLEGSRYLDPVPVTSTEEAERLLTARKVLGILRFRSSFARQMAASDMSGVQLVVRGTDSNTARLAIAYVTAAFSGASSTPAPLRWEPRFWFNSVLNSRYYLVPGTLAVILTVIGAMLTALVIAREYELGTFEKIRSTPVSAVELVVARLLPYFTYGMAGALLTFLAATYVFGVPFRGSYLLLAMAAALYLTIWLSVGVLVSGLSKSQFVSAQVTLILGFLPSFMLSGFIFEIRSMPGWLQAVTYVFPPRYLVAIVQTLFLAGDVPEVLLPNLAALGVMSVVAILAAGVVLRRNLRAAT